jgi:DNA-binding CsgD family transcriptional regulator
MSPPDQDASPNHPVAAVRHALEDAMSQGGRRALLIRADGGLQPLHAMPLPPDEGRLHFATDRLRHDDDGHQHRLDEALAAAREGHRITVILPVAPERFARLTLSPLPEPARGALPAPVLLLHVDWRGLGQSSVPDAEHLQTALGLTEAQSRVLHRLCGGMTPKDVAAELGCSVHTVRTHIAQILARLGMHRQGELVRRAMQLG